MVATMLNSFRVPEIRRKLAFYPEDVRLHLLSHLGDRALGGDTEDLRQRERRDRLDKRRSADGHRALWEKALVLVPMATITSLCREPIGPIRELPETHELIVSLLDEVSAVARAHGCSSQDRRVGAQDNAEISFAGTILEGAPTS